MDLHFHPASNLTPDFEIAFRLLVQSTAGEPTGVTEDTVYAAVSLLFKHPEHGQIILGFDGEKAISVCVVNFLISPFLGAWTGKVEVLYVVPEYRWKSVGTEMLDWIKEVLQGHGFTELGCSPGKKNRRAIQLLEKVGFLKSPGDNFVCSLSETE